MWYYQEYLNYLKSTEQFISIIFAVALSDFFPFPLSYPLDFHKPITNENCELFSGKHLNEA